MADAKAMLEALGLAEKLVSEILKNAALTAKHVQIIRMAGVERGCEKAIGALVNEVASSLASKLKDDEAKIGFLLGYITTGRVRKPQLAAAVAYLQKHTIDNVAEFEASCGVGLTYTPQQIAAACADLIAREAAVLRESRYHTNTGKYLGDLARTALPFVDGGALKDEFDRQLAAFLGPRTAADDEPPAKKKPAAAKGSNATSTGAAPAAAAVSAAAAAAAAPAAAAAVDDDDVRAMLPPAETIYFPDPRDNEQDDPELLRKHLAATGGMVVTRFPPEPNGFPHIGHAKSMSLNFGYAKTHGGKCYLRYDDTNPETEKQEYFDAIREAVEWLGHTPCAVTCASDYYQHMYDYAVQLIREGKAYVDHQTKPEIEAYRAERKNSPWRDRPIAESLRLFEDMRKGKLAEGEATLRLKMDMQSDNPCMRDLIAYRVKFHAHPKSGDAWCVYPSYDFEHCIVDTIENITHSLCTLEFGLRRESYHWLLRALGLYRPVVWEYSRLNVGHVVVSKRKLTLLVSEGFVDGWDDPRMPTLFGLRRRGYTPSSLNRFVELVGVTRSENLISYSLLEHVLREELNDKCERRMVVTQPLKVVISNWAAERVDMIECAKFPQDKSRASETYSVPLSKELYIEAKDFREVDSKDYFGLAPDKVVRLKYGPCVRCTGVTKDAASGKVTELAVTLVEDSKATSKAKVLHWVSCPEPGRPPSSIELRLYDVLFLTENVASVENWRTDVNPNSLTVLHGMCNLDMALHPPETAFQFERVGYFVVDKNSTPLRPIYNRSVALKESKDKVKA